MNKKVILRLFRLLSIGICSLTMLVGCLLGFSFFARPVESQVEKRELTTFPSFSVQSFLNGDFFSEVSLWYSDTFPFRDSLISMAQSFKTMFYGPEQDTMVIGDNKTADAIPEEGKQTEDKKTETAELPENFAFDQEMQSQIMDSMYIKDGAAYSMYYFNQDACDIYVNDVINYTAKELDGISNVYSILVPINSVTLPEEELQKLGGSDMEQAMKYYYSLFDGATGIDTVKTLKKHSDEYLFFRTDHHWTTLAAYYVYQNYCKEKGWDAQKLDEMESMTFSPFLGTYYNELLLPEMAANPDYVTAYIPNSTNELTYWDENGQAHDWHIIEDVSSWDTGSGYYTFIGGDKPLTIIDNPDIDDGSSVLVIKESYGNCFVPFLVDHYDKVYIADYRYTNINIVDYAKENKIDDVIYCNNMVLLASENIPLTLKELCH